jgi:hypothetical protein
MIRLIGLDAIKHHVAPAFWTRRMQDRNRIRSICLITHMRIPRVQTYIWNFEESIRNLIRWITGGKSPPPVPAQPAVVARPDLAGIPTRATVAFGCIADKRRFLASDGLSAYDCQLNRSMQHRR